MKDGLNRTIDYLRISVTDRCNLRCRYCMPAEGIDQVSHEDILSYEEIVEFARVATAMGIRKIRLTGGEPLVRKNVVVLVAALARLPDLEELCMTTNGTLLERHAHQLRESGLDRINVSLDTLCPERYAGLTRGGDVSRVLAGIEAALDAGFHPVKLNCVVERSRHDEDAKAVAAFGAEKGLPVRFIRRMSIKDGSFQVVDGGDGGRCQTCNRLRLSSDGYLRPCLFSDIKHNIRSCSYSESIRAVVDSKPPHGTFSMHNQMHRIGG